MIVGLLFVVLIAALVVLGIWYVLGVWGIAAFMVGVVGYILLPMLARSYTVSEWLGQLYARTGFRALGRGLLVARGAGYSLVRSQHNDDYGTEHASLDETKNWGDPNNWMSHLYGKPFGVTTDSIGIIVTPLVAEIGRRMADLKHAGEWDREVVVQSGESRERRRQLAKHVDLHERMVPVDIRDASLFAAGDADPSSADTGKEYGKKSQEKKGQPVSFGQVGAWLTAFITGAAVIWFVMSYGGDVGGAVDNVADNETIPVMLEVMLR